MRVRRLLRHHHLQIWAVTKQDKLLQLLSMPAKLKMRLQTRRSNSWRLRQYRNSHKLPQEWKYRLLEPKPRPTRLPLPKRELQPRSRAHQWKRLLNRTQSKPSRTHQDSKRTTIQLSNQSLPKMSRKSPNKYPKQWEILKLTIDCRALRNHQDNRRTINQQLHSLRASQRTLRKWMINRLAHLLKKRCHQATM